MTGARQRAVIVDLDGTVALRTGTREFFHWHRVGEDEVNTAVANLVRLIAAAGLHKILLVSGRDEICRPHSSAWLAFNYIPSDLLLMRRHRDNRPDDIVKVEIYRHHIEPYYDVDFVLDDRDRVVRAWRELGLTCLQVAEGAF